MTDPNWPNRPILKVTIKGWRTTLKCWLKDHLWKDDGQTAVCSPTGEYMPGQYCERCLSTR